MKLLLPSVISVELGKWEVDTRWIPGFGKFPWRRPLISELRPEVWWNLLGKGSGGESFSIPGCNTGQRKHVYFREWQVCVSLKLAWVKEREHTPLFWLQGSLPPNFHARFRLELGEGRSFKVSGNWTFWFRLDSTFKKDFLYFYERNGLKEQ